MSLDLLRFQQILRDARSRSPSTGTDTMVVAAHLAQMRLFMVRQGVEFFARQDTYSLRRDFIRRVVDFNELPGRLESIIDSYLIDGRGLLYFRPSKDLYRIHYFTKDQYRTFYNEDNELEEVQVIYPFRVRSQLGYAAGLGMPDAGVPGGSNFTMPGNQEVRWVMMRIFVDRIVQTITTQQPQFDSSLYGLPQGQTRTYQNTLGLMPAVEVFNNRGLNAGEGFGEFDWLASYILEHDRMVKNIRKNLQFFGTPTLVSSRPRQDLIEPDDSTGGRRAATVAANSGFIGLNRGATRGMDPLLYGSEGGIRVPRIIANVEAADRVGYIMPDPISGDLTGYAAQYQEMIRAALGGVDDLSLSSGATAYEVRTIFGRVATTAKRKCRDLYEYGFCRLFTLMILNEERLFRDSFSAAVGLKKPMPILVEELPPEQRNPKVIAEIQQKYDQALTAYGVKLQTMLQQAQETGQMPPNVIGLMPDGDTRVDFRWTGDVFADSPQELLQNSIVCRNLQELGVSSIEALQYLFPDKTPEERAGMLGGYPFRMAEATQRSIGVYMDLLRGFYQVPHPQQPDMPLAADPNLDVVPYLYNAMAFLQRELSYSGTFQNVDPATLPASLSDADRLRAERGRTTELERRSEQRRDAFRAAAQRSGGLLGAGVSGPGGSGGAPSGTDADALVPGFGGTLGFDPTQPYPAATGQLGGANGMGRTGGTSALDAFGGTLGAADLLAPSNAGVPGAELFTGGPAAVPAGRGRPSRNGSRRPR
jgi:hypothetical protein